MWVNIWFIRIYVEDWDDDNMIMTKLAYLTVGPESAFLRAPNQKDKDYSHQNYLYAIVMLLNS